MGVPIRYTRSGSHLESFLGSIAWQFTQVAIPKKATPIIKRDHQTKERGTFRRSRVEGTVLNWGLVLKRRLKFAIMTSRVEGTVPDRDSLFIV